MENKKQVKSFEPLRYNRFLMAIEGIDAFRVMNVSFNKKKMYIHLHALPDGGFDIVNQKRAVKAELSLLDGLGNPTNKMKFNLTRTDFVIGQHDFSYSSLQQPTIFSYTNNDPMIITVFFDIRGDIEYEDVKN
jgi:hypothetical protein